MTQAQREESESLETVLRKGFRLVALMILAGFVFAVCLAGPLYAALELLVNALATGRPAVR